MARPPKRLSMFKLGLGKVRPPPLFGFHMTLIDRTKQKHSAFSAHFYLAIVENAVSF